MKGVSFAFLVALQVGCAPQWGLQGVGPAPSLDHLAYAIHQRANTVRAARGLPALGWRGGLAGVADRHSLDMVHRSYFAHRTPEGETAADRVRQQGVVCRVPAGAHVGIAENLFLSSRYDFYRLLPGGVRQYHWLAADQIAAQAVAAWMASPGHRATLLDPSSSGHGIGVAVSGDQRVYITDVLC